MCAWVLEALDLLFAYSLQMLIEVSVGWFSFLYRSVLVR